MKFSPPDGYELEIFEDYCKAVDRTKSDVLRELIRSLKAKKKPSFTTGGL
jgi:hypothetical protein